MPYRTHEVTGAGAEIVNTVYPYVEMFNGRPCYESAANIHICWIGGAYTRWIIGPYHGYQAADRYYDCPQYPSEGRTDVLLCGWQLGGHPDTVLPLPVVGIYVPPPPPAGPSATDLLCEGHVSPARMLDPTPTFAWTYVPGDCPGPQDAYRILVATAPELLEVELADLWDSGIIEGAAAQTTYAGALLPDNTMVFYQVRVRDSDQNWSTD